MQFKLSHAIVPCSPMMELLFARLPPALRGLAMRQLGRFLTGSCLPSVAHEAAVLANAAAWADPAGALSGYVYLLWIWCIAALPWLPSTAPATDGCRGDAALAVPLISLGDRVSS